MTSLLLGFSCMAQSADLGVQAYDCWVGNAGANYTTHFIRCIVDRDSMAVGSGDEAGGVLDLIHAQLHAGAVTEAEKTLRANADYLLHRNLHYWSVALYSYPAEWSWANGLPGALVQSALCNTSLGCRSLFHRQDNLLVAYPAQR